MFERAAVRDAQAGRLHIAITVALTVRSTPLLTSLNNPATPLSRPLTGIVCTTEAVSIGSRHKQAKDVQQNRHDTITCTGRTGRRTQGLGSSVE